MDQQWETISAIDLTSVRNKFLARKGFWWRLGRSAVRIENEYRQMLYLIAARPGQTIVPWSQDVDDFWHEHILNTEKYASDCQALLGGFIHHNPHLPEGSPEHSKAFKATREMYETAFKETINNRRNGSSAGAGCTASMPAAFSDGGSAAHHGGAHGSADITVATDAGAMEAATVVADMAAVGEGIKVDARRATLARCRSQ